MTRVAKVDIIIPAYNASRYLAAAIESVICQTFPDWRIVLVDDGSTDDTPAIGAHYAELLGDRMVVVTQENRGLPAARNVAIRQSSAELIAILDADDIWLPCRLQESIAVLEVQKEAGLSYGLITRIDENGKELNTFEGNRDQVEGRMAPSIYTRRVELPCPTITFRRSCVDEVGLFDETMRATEDRDLWLRIALKFPVAFIPKVIAYYRTTNSSMSADLDRMLAAQLRFIDKHYGSPGCGFRARRIAVSRAFKQKAEALLRRGRRFPALLDAYRGFFFWPIGVDNFRTALSVTLICLGVKRKI